LGIYLLIIERPLKSTGNNSIMLNSKNHKWMIIPNWSNKLMKRK
jgi:hypothetical protein